MAPRDPDIPPALVQYELGTRVPGIYASEFGCAVYPSFESLSPALPQSDWSLHGDTMCVHGRGGGGRLAAWGHHVRARTGVLLCRVTPARSYHPLPL